MQRCIYSSCLASIMSLFLDFVFLLHPTVEGFWGRTWFLFLEISRIIIMYCQDKQMVCKWGSL